jgi:hypothetical protein
MYLRIKVIRVKALLWDVWAMDSGSITQQPIHPKIKVLLVKVLPDADAPWNSEPASGIIIMELSVLTTFEVEGFRMVSR